MSQPVDRESLNDRIAAKATNWFGSMWTTYAFMVYGLVPIVVPSLMTIFLYWSNWVQLWSLPLILVGTAVLGRAMVRQAQETHDAVVEELGIVKEELAAIREQHAELGQILAAISKPTS